MQNQRKIMLWISVASVFCALTIAIFGTVLSLVQQSSTVTNVGWVKGVGVGIYWDSACTNETSSINWGIVDPGSSKMVYVYVRNEGNTAVTLSLTTQNWNPSSVASFMTLNWNYAGQTLLVNQVLRVRLTLDVSSTISGVASFSFDTMVIATG